VPRIRRQDRRGKAYPSGPGRKAVANRRRAHLDRADASLDRLLRHMTVPHEPLAAVVRCDARGSEYLSVLGLRLKTLPFLTLLACEVLRKNPVRAACEHGNASRLYSAKEAHRHVVVGGLDEGIRDAISAALQRVGFSAEPVRDLAGLHPNNICNRGRNRAGVQLEISRALRNGLRASAADMDRFASAVRLAVDATIGNEQSQK